MSFSASHADDVEAETICVSDPERMEHVAPILVVRVFHIDEGEATTRGHLLQFFERKKGLRKRVRLAIETPDP